MILMKNKNKNTGLRGFVLLVTNLRASRVKGTIHHLRVTKLDCTLRIVTYTQNRAGGTFNVLLLRVGESKVSSDCK